MKSRNFERMLHEMEKRSDLDTVRKSMKTALAYLTSKDICGVADVEDGLIQFTMSGKVSRTQVLIQFDSEKKQARLRVVPGVNCCKQNRRMMCELICHINFGMVSGMFEYDPRDGEYTFKYVHYIGDNPMSEAQFHRALGFSLATMAHYEDTLLPLCMGFEPKPDKACMEYGIMRGADGLEEMLRRSLDEDDDEDEDEDEDDDEDEAEEDLP